MTYPLSATTVDVYNAGYTAGLAGNVSAGLVAAGFTQGQVANTTIQSTTEVSYGSGAAAQANAARIAALFGVTAQASSSVSAGHVKVVLGTSATLPELRLLVPGFVRQQPGELEFPEPVQYLRFRQWRRRQWRRRHVSVSNNALRRVYAQRCRGAAHCSAARPFDTPPGSRRRASSRRQQCPLPASPASTDIAASGLPTATVQPAGGA